MLATTMVLSGGDFLLKISKLLDRNEYEIKVVTTRLGYDLWLPQSLFDRYVTLDWRKA